MPTASAIVINDGQATPVGHTFEPNQISPSNSVFTDKDSLTSAGQKQLIVGFSPANGSRKTTRVNLRLNFPVEQTISDVTTVAYTARFNGDIVIPDQMNQAQRDDLGAFIKNFLSNTVVNAVVTDLDPIY